MHTADTTPPAEMPIVPAAIARRLPVAVGVSTFAAMLACAVVVAATGRADWWPAFAAATVTSLIGGGLSIVVLGQTAGRRMDWLVTIVMGATAARMGVSLIGLLISVRGLHTPAEPTGFMICGFYVAVLVAESAVLIRTTRPAGGNHA